MHIRRRTPRSKHAAPSYLAFAERLPLGFLGTLTVLLVASVIAIILIERDPPRNPASAWSASVKSTQSAWPAPAVSDPGSLPELSAAQMAGQRVIYSYSGLAPPGSLLSWIRHGEVGGVIFFAPNIASDTQLDSVVSELDAANASVDNPMRSFPLLLMTDQEGGLVRRLPGAPVLSEKQIGESADPGTQARDAGAGAAADLAGVGINVNLAPVLDVYRRAGDFDDRFGRSYGTSPREVAYLGARFIKAQQALRVASTAKHFPGLGTATSTQDSDVRPVTLNVSLRTLRSVDEYPYRTAIAAGVKLVMVSWATYPALDPRWPAGLSPAIIQGELRKRLGFTGVTITDALEAGALQPFGAIQRRATLAASAGMDLILCSGQNADEGEQARDGLDNGYLDGKLAKATFRAAMEQIVTLRSGLAH